LTKKFAKDLGVFKISQECFCMAMTGQQQRYERLFSVDWRAPVVVCGEGVLGQAKINIGPNALSDRNALAAFGAVRKRVSGYPGFQIGWMPGDESSEEPRRFTEFIQRTLKDAPVTEDFKLIHDSHGKVFEYERSCRETETPHTLYVGLTLEIKNVGRGLGPHYSTKLRATETKGFVISPEDKESVAPSGLSKQHYQKWIASALRL
jgi:hypothetical protein